MIFFTADLHLGHANIIRHCNRPFANPDMMDEALIENWNERVHRNDTVYILGDLIFRASCPSEAYLSRLKGRKHLIIGNHDHSWLKRSSSGELIPSPATEAFESISHFKVISMSVGESGGSGERGGRARGTVITLCHYPMMTWQGAGHGGLMIFGHIHNNTNAAYWPLIRASPQMLNAGVDVNDFQPVMLEELIENNERFKAQTTSS